MKNKKNLLVCGNYGAKNAGDELILLGIKNYFKDEEITILSEKKYTQLKTYAKFPAGIKSLISFLKGNKENLKALKDSDYFIFGGGNLFGGPSKKANFIWAIQALFAIFYKKPIVSFCQSVGNNTNKVIEILIKYIFNKSFKIYLRDEESATNLKKYGVTKKITTLSDPAILLHSAKPKDKELDLIIALRQKNNIKENFISEIQNFLNNNFQNKKIKFLNFETGIENDNDLHKKIIEKLKIKSQIGDFETNPELVIDEFAKTKTALCMRLHSIIVAIITNVPFIAISYAHKIDSFLKYANLEDLIIKEDEISEKILSKKFKYLEENEKDIKLRMQNFLSRSREKFKSEFKDLFQENVH